MLPTRHVRARTRLKEVKRLDGARRRFESVITGIFSNDAVRADATCICATGFRGKGRKVIYRCWRLARAVRLDRRFIQQALAHLGELHEQGARADQNRDHAHANAMTGAREKFCFNFNRNRQALSPTSRQADPIGWRRALERADLVIPHADGIYSNCHWLGSRNPLAGRCDGGAYSRQRTEHPTVRDSIRLPAVFAFTPLVAQHGTTIDRSAGATRHAVRGDSRPIAGHPALVCPFLC